MKTINITTRKNWDVDSEIVGRAMRHLQQVMEESQALPELPPVERVDIMTDFGGCSISFKLYHPDATSLAIYDDTFTEMVCPMYETVGLSIEHLLGTEPWGGRHKTRLSETRPWGMNRGRIHNTLEVWEQKSTNPAEGFMARASQRIVNDLRGK